MSIKMYQQSILVTKYQESLVTPTVNTFFVLYKRIDGQKARIASMMFGKVETIGADSSLCCRSPK